MLDPFRGKTADEIAVALEAAADAQAQQQTESLAETIARLVRRNDEKTRIREFGREVSWVTGWVGLKVFGILCKIYFSARDPREAAFIQKMQLHLLFFL